jgi:hypothetical protein
MVTGLWFLVFTAKSQSREVALIQYQISNNLPRETLRHRAFAVKLLKSLLKNNFKSQIEFLCANSVDSAPLR